MNVNKIIVNDYNIIDENNKKKENELVDEINKEKINDIKNKEEEKDVKC